MTPDEAAAEMRRLSDLIDKGVRALSEAAVEKANAEHAYRLARGRAWVELAGEQMLAKEKEDQVNAQTADARLGRDIAEGAEKAALEAQRSRRQQLSALQTWMNGQRAEAEFARTGPSGVVA